MAQSNAFRFPRVLSTVQEESGEGDGKFVRKIWKEEKNNPTFYAFFQPRPVVLQQACNDDGGGLLWPQGSPAVNRQQQAGGGKHPLEVQSPLTPIAFVSRAAAAAAAGAADPPPSRAAFTPTHASTETALDDRLGAIQVPPKQATVGTDLNKSMLDRAPTTDIDRFQRDLSGDDPAQVRRDLLYSALYSSVLRTYRMSQKKKKLVHMIFPTFNTR